MVTAEIVDGVIVLKGSFRECGPDRAKRIAGCRSKYDKPKTQGGKFQHWYYPLSITTARALRREFGASLQLGPKLTEWGWDARRKAEQLEELRAGGTADLPRVRAEAPHLWEMLQNRPYQIAGAAAIAGSMRFCMGDAPRLGKTYQALAAMIETGVQRVLIACPRTATRTVWMRKINELAPQYMPFVAQGSRAEREQTIAAFNGMPYARKVLVINLEMIRVKRRYRCLVNADGKPTPFRLKGQPENRVKPGSKNGCQGNHKHDNVYYPEWPQLFEGEWDAVILDESHHALASQYNKQSANITQIRMGAVRLPIRKDGMALAMSGTPFRSQVLKSWGTLNWLRPDVFSSFWRFAETHFEVTQGAWGKEIGKKLRDEQAFQDELRPYYMARTKVDAAPWLPPVQYAGTPPADNPDGLVGVYLPMEGDQAKAYHNMVKLAAASVDGGTLRATGILAELTRCKQLACAYGRLTADEYYPALPSNKFEWLLDFLSERESVPGKVVVASQFTRLVNLFAQELRSRGHAVVTITGESNDAQREHAQDEFMNGRTRIAVINTFAGGEAIDLSAADEMVLLDEPWTADAREQVENRIVNLSKRSQLTIYRLRSEGTIEEWIASLNEDQLELLRSASPQALKLAKEALSS